MELFVALVVIPFLLGGYITFQRSQYTSKMDKAAALVTQARENMMFGNELATVSAFRQLTEAREILTGWKERR